MTNTTPPLPPEIEEKIKRLIIYKIAERDIDGDWEEYQLLSAYSAREILREVLEKKAEEFYKKGYSDAKSGKIVFFAESECEALKEEEKDLGQKAIKCQYCNDKGYNTVCYDEIGADDFGGEGYVKKAQVRKIPCRKCQPQPAPEDWKKDFEQEFGIHFKNSSGELQFAIAFIEELLEKIGRNKNRR